jgi:anti-sigma B factor antagonist
MGKEQDGRDDAVVILEVAGEFDAANLPRFCAKVDGILGEGIRRVVLDLRELKLADSEMLGQMLRIQQRLRKAGGDVVLLRPGRLLMRTLEVLGLHEVFTICHSRAEALRALVPHTVETRDEAHAAGPENVWRITRVS